MGDLEQRKRKEELQKLEQQKIQRKKEGEHQLFASLLYKPCIHYSVEMYVIPISTIFVEIPFIFLSNLWDRVAS